MPSFAREVVNGIRSLSTCHRAYSDYGVPQPIPYSEMIAWLDENEYRGDQREAALEIMRTWDVTWRSKKIEELEFSRQQQS